MSNKDWLDPTQARDRFGPLRDRVTEIHLRFTEPTGGEWRPELGPGLLLIGYRLHQSERAPVGPQPR